MGFLVEPLTFLFRINRPGRSSGLRISRVIFYPGAMPAPAYILNRAEGAIRRLKIPGSYLRQLIWLFCMRFAIYYDGMAGGVLVC